MILIKPNIVCDISNVAKNNCRSEGAKLYKIHLMYNALKYNYWVIGVADLSLFREIDDRVGYKYEYLERNIIYEVPSREDADYYIIKKAILLDCYILSNDHFRDYAHLFPDKSWLETHRVSFMIIDGDFIYRTPK
ncbi:MAG: hypothetical protein ACFFDF_10360 [Candidatus Odinarchaeota archaeon]